MSASGLRVTSDFWVSAVVRRAFSAGGFAAVERRGAQEAGAIMITLRDRLGEVRLFAPAPQASYDTERPADRHFTEVLRTTDEEALRQRIEREMRFDPDLWVVDLEVDEAIFAQLVPVTTP